MIRRPLLRSNRFASRRNGTTMVETAFVLVIFTMLLFGIIEYGRFIFVRQVVDNAAREGARYAVVNTSSSTLVADTKNVVHKRMAGVQNMLQLYTVDVYTADSTGNNVGPPDTAEFGENIAVEISCTYDPILPSFLMLSNNIPIRTKALMNSEAN